MLSQTDRLFLKQNLIATWPLPHSTLGRDLFIYDKQMRAAEMAYPLLSHKWTSHGSRKGLFLDGDSETAVYK